LTTTSSLRPHLAPQRLIGTANVYSHLTSDH